MKKALFGPAGNSQSFYDAGHKHSCEMPAYLNELGLTGMNIPAARA